MCQYVNVLYEILNMTTVNLWRGGTSVSVPTGEVSPRRRFISVLKYILVHKKCKLGILTGVPSSQVLPYYDMYTIIYFATTLPRYLRSTWAKASIYSYVSMGAGKSLRNSFKSPAASLGRIFDHTKLRLLNFSSISWRRDCKK